MAKQDEITSTEKLLTLIRSDDDGTDTPSEPPAGRFSRKPKKGKPRKAKPIRIKPRKSVTLGVDFGRDGIRMALCSDTHDKKPVLMHYGHVPYDPSLTSRSPRFPVFLKKTLDTFCGSYKNVHVWSSIPSANVETKFLRIPKVPKKQIANTVFWTHKRESNFDEKTSLFDFDLIGDTVEDGIQRTEVISYTAPREEVDALKRIFAKTGYPLTGVSIVPFALQNLFRTGWTETGGKNVCTLFIGTDWSRIAIFSDRNLVLSRDIKAGLKSMIQAIADNIEKVFPDFSVPLEDEEELSLETPGSDIASPFIERAQKILNGFIADDIAAFASDTDANLTFEDVFQMIVPALDRVVRQVERTLDHYSLNFSSERVGRVYLSGPVCSHERLVHYIGEQLGLSVDFIDPFFTDLPGAVDVLGPETTQERGDFVPAVGMALSANTHTPNFVHTYKDKEKVERVARFNRAIFGVSIIIMMVCIGYFAWQSGRLDKKKDRIFALQQKLEQFIPRVDQNMILQLASHSFKDQKSVDAFAEKYRGMAIISEIVKVTPHNVRLADLLIQMGGVGGKKGSVSPRTVVMEGVVSGDRLNFESALAGYMLKLERSPMFGSPEILSQSFDTLEDEAVLKFKAQVDII